MKLLEFLKGLLSSKRRESCIDVKRDTILPTPDGWRIPRMGAISTQLVYREGGEDTISLTYMGDKNQLELSINSEELPANITSRSLTTINSRLKKAGKALIIKELFNEWEDDLIEAQGKGKNTYHSKRYPVKRTK